MARFKHTDNSQGQFMVVNLKEQLFPDTFEWTIDYLINKMDMSLFEKKYNNDETGAAAYPPRALLKIILYCYSRGIITSRKIEKMCTDNITVKALAEDCEPDHATIAAFISANEEAVKDMFTQILLQCAQLKLITGEMFAVDGCKLPSNASKEWSGTIEDLKKKRDKDEPLKKALLEGDTGYFSEANLQEAADRGINVLMPDPQFRQRDPHFTEKKNEKVEKKRFTAEDFKYDEGSDSFTCPRGKTLECKGEVTLRNNSGKKYGAKRADCAQCPLMERCIARRNGKNPARTLYRACRKTHFSQIL
ncbi:hypothetical protein R84B8_01215 [Treponema sp. R8-4-B8]